MDHTRVLVKYKIYRFFYRGSTQVNLVLFAQHLLHSTLQEDIAFGRFLDSPNQKEHMTNKNESRILRQ